MRFYYFLFDKDSVFILIETAESVTPALDPGPGPGSAPVPVPGSPHPISSPSRLQLHFWIHHLKRGLALAQDHYYKVKKNFPISFSSAENLD